MPVDRITIDGAKEVLARLQKLGPEVRNKITQKACKRAIDPIVADARELAPRGKGPLAGMLSRSIESKLFRTETTVGYVAGPTFSKTQLGIRQKGKNKGKPYFKIPTRYAHLVEFGTSHSAAEPFMRPAWEALGGERALDTFIAELWFGIDEFLGYRT